MIHKINRFMSDMDDDAFQFIFMGLPAIILIVLFICGLAEYHSTSRLHLWSVMTFFTIAFYGIAGSVVVGSMFYSEKLAELLFILFLVSGFKLTLVTFLIALWQFHWILGLVLTTMALIVVGFIVASLLKEEEDV